MLEYIQVAFNFGVSIFNQATRIFTTNPVILTALLTLVFVSLVMTYVIFPVLKHDFRSASDSVKKDIGWKK